MFLTTFVYISFR